MARRGVDKRDWFPLPFTLLDKVLCFALLAKNALSNRVNPLPPGEGRLLGDSANVRRKFSDLNMKLR